jgi:hypothetical protein
MSDTMTGTVGGGTSVPNPVNVHDSTVEQGDGCLTPHLAKIPYGSTWYWPGSTVVVGNTMEVFSYKVVPASGQPGFEWRVVGTSVTRFTLPGLQLVSGPDDMPTNTISTGEAIPWGIRSFLNPADNMVYLYGTTKHPIPNTLYTDGEAWVARAPAGQETDQSKWEFFTDSTVALPDCPTLPPPLPPWSTKFACAKPMKFTKSDGSAVGSPLAQLSAVPYGNRRYLAGAFVWDTVAPEIGAWTSDSPSGPWVQQSSNAAMFHPRDRQIAYDARIAKLPGPGWTVVYSENDPYNQNGDFTLYRGEFATPNGLPPESP